MAAHLIASTARFVVSLGSHVMLMTMTMTKNGVIRA
jgi:hypothetical protein